MRGNKNCGIGLCKNFSAFAVVHGDEGVAVPTEASFFRRTDEAFCQRSLFFFSSSSSLLSCTFLTSGYGPIAQRRRTADLKRTEVAK